LVQRDAFLPRLSFAPYQMLDLEKGTDMAFVFTDFSAKRHGFHFLNAFSITPVPSILLPTGDTTPALTLAGLCGGMAFPALDYFRAPLPVPTHEPTDYGAGGVPPTSSRLFSYIFQRHLNSIGLNVVTLGTPLPGMPIPVSVLPGDLFNARAFAQKALDSDAAARAALPGEVSKITASINAGAPVVLSLVAQSSLADSHQVIATGFDDSTPGSTRIIVYDSRFPDREIFIDVSPSASVPIALGELAEPWHGLFVEHYAQVTPTYLDWMLVSDLTAVNVAFPGSRKFNTRFFARNDGDAPARALAMVVSIDPEFVGDEQVSDPTQPINVTSPGGLVQFSQDADFPPSFAGSDVTLRACYIRADGNIITLPPLDGAQGSIGLQVPSGI
jgi:hypothetical protein